MRLILALVGLLVSYKVEASLTKYVYVCGETTYSTSMPTETVAAILDSNSTAKASGTTVAVASGSVVGGYLSASGSVPCNGTSDSTATSNAASASATGGDFYETVVATVSPVRASGTQSASTAAASVSSSGPVVVSTSSISSTAAKYSSSSSTTLQASSSVSSSSTTPTTTTTSVEPTATPFTPTPNSAYLAIAKSAITALTGNYSTTSRQWGGITGWIAANAYNDIMDYDHYTGSKTYENTYGAGLLEIALSTDLQGTVLSTDAYNDDQLWWCLSMLRAHTNYGHIELLTQTIKQWQQITESSLLTAADQGTAPTKGGIIRESVIPATCDVDGGVYWAQLGDSNVNAISTSLYVMVSAWLFEITKEAQYKAAADKSLGWLQRVMLDSKSGIMTIDSITPTGCVKNLGSLTYNTGVYIGALTSLYRSTLLSTYLTPLLVTLNSSSTGYFGNTPALVISQQNDLIAPSDATEWRDILFRNMIDGYVLLAEKGISAKIQIQMKEFFTANFNQIQSKAKFGDLYSANWFGLLSEGTDWGTASVLSCLSGKMMLG